MYDKMNKQIKTKNIYFCTGGKHSLLWGSSVFSMRIKLLSVRGVSSDWKEIEKRRN